MTAVLALACVLRYTLTERDPPGHIEGARPNPQRSRQRSTAAPTEATESMSLPPAVCGQDATLLTSSLGRHIRRAAQNCE